MVWWNNDRLESMSSIHCGYSALTSSVKDLKIISGAIIAGSGSVGGIFNPIVIRKCRKHFVAPYAYPVFIIRIPNIHHKFLRKVKSLNVSAGLTVNFFSVVPPIILTCQRPRPMRPCASSVAGVISAPF